MRPDPPGFFPPPRIIPPLSQPHKTTAILLHGRGLSAHSFGPDLISTPFPFPFPSPSPPPSSSTLNLPPQPSTSTSTQIPDPKPSPQSNEHTTTSSLELTTLRTLLPHTKLLLPLAPRHRATIYARSIIHQWFDSWHLNNPNEPIDAEEWRCVDGLRDTVAYLHRLIREEAELVGGVQNVVLGGLSQGCAASLMALLLWEGDALGGYVGMCGWLVFEKDVRGVLAGGEEDGDEGEGGFDPFEREDEDEGEEELTVEAQVVRALREKLELEGGGEVKSRPRSFDTPIFLGHGTEDDKVPVARGKGAAECLRVAGLNPEWKVYQGLGHWYSPDMLTDMAAFLTDRAGWE